MIPSPVKKIEVINLSTFTRQRKITWDFNPENNIIGYNVYRSEVAYADYEKINQSLITVNYYEDTPPSTSVSPFFWWYKVTAVNDLQEESSLIDTLPSTDEDANLFIDQPLEQKPPYTLSEQDKLRPFDGNKFQYLPSTKINPRWFLEIRKRHQWILQMSGTKCILLKRRWSGPLCPNFDALRRQHRQVATEGSIDPCYGTGFLGGYHTPTYILVSLASPLMRSVLWREAGFWTSFDVKNWTLWEPNLLDRDVIVKLDTGERFEIQNVSRTNWRGLILRQNFDTILIEPTNIIYKVPIPI